MLLNLDLSIKVALFYAQICLHMSLVRDWCIHPWDFCCSSMCFKSELIRFSIPIWAVEAESWSRKR